MHIYINISYHCKFNTYFSKSSIMFSGSKPPYTLNFFILHTCVFSYLPNVIVFTIEGNRNFNIRN